MATVNHFDLLNELYSQLLNSKWISFEEVKEKKKVIGVYIIYSKAEEILYIGSTNNFNVRFGTDLCYESTHTLLRKLLKTEVHPNKVVAIDHFKNHYKYKIQMCASKREAEALEHLAIWALTPRFNK